MTTRDVTLSDDDDDNETALNFVLVRKSQSLNKNGQTKPFSAKPRLRREGQPRRLCQRQLAAPCPGVQQTPRPPVPNTNWSGVRDETREIQKPALVGRAWQLPGLPQKRTDCAAKRPREAGDN